MAKKSLLLQRCSRCLATQCGTVMVSLLLIIAFQATLVNSGTAPAAAAATTPPPRFQHHRIIGAGGTISVQEHGGHVGDATAPTLLFVHDFAQSHLAWIKQLEDKELSDAFRLISYDLRGHGGSDKQPNRDRHELFELYSMHEAHALDLDAVMTALDVRKALVNCWGWGCFPVLAHLRKYNHTVNTKEEVVGGGGGGGEDGSTMPPPVERIRAVHFVGSAPAFGSSASTRWLGQCARLWPDLSHELLRPRVDATLRYINCFYSDITKADITDIQRAVVAMGMVPAELRRAFLRLEAFGPDVVRNILAHASATNGVNFFVTHGTQDELFLVRAGTALAEIASSAVAAADDDGEPGASPKKNTDALSVRHSVKMKEFVGIGHLPFIEDPVRFNQHLLKIHRAARPELSQRKKRKNNKKRWSKSKRMKQKPRYNLKVDL